MIGKKIDELIEKINSMNEVYIVWWYVFFLLLMLTIVDAVA